MSSFTTNVPLTTDGSIIKLPQVTVSGTVKTFKVVISGPGGRCIFQASPLLSESRTANYEGYAITHLPTDIYAYKNTNGRRFQLQGKMISRTASEAQENAKYLDLIRTWMEPDFGGTGATPPIVKLSAYNNNNISGTQCIIRAYGFGWPDDIDFIHESVPPMPIIGQLTVELDEVYSAEQITDGRWQLKVSDGGFFEGGEGADSSVPTTILPDNFPGLASAKAGLSKTHTVLDDLKNVIKHPSTISSSPEVSDDTSRTGGINSNPLISGTSPDQLLSEQATANQQAVSQQQGAASNFKRTAVSPPTIILG